MLHIDHFYFCQFIPLIKRNNKSRNLLWFFLTIKLFRPTLFLHSFYIKISLLKSFVRLALEMYHLIFLADNKLLRKVRLMSRLFNVHCFVDISSIV